MRRVTKQEIEEAKELNLGFCTQCEEWTGECVEPDARNYECPDCNSPTVVGFETLLFEVL